MTDDVRKSTDISLLNFANSRDSRKEINDQKDKLFKQDADLCAEPMYNYAKVELTDEKNKFLIKHQSDPKKDKTCHLIWKNRVKTLFKWKGLEGKKGNAKSRLLREWAHSELRNEPPLDMSGRSPQYPFMASLLQT